MAKNSNIFCYPVIMAAMLSIINTISLSRNGNDLDLRDKLITVGSTSVAVFFYSMIVWRTYQLDTQYPDRKDRSTLLFALSHVWLVADTIALNLLSSTDIGVAWVIAVYTATWCVGLVIAMWVAMTKTRDTPKIIIADPEPGTPNSGISGIELVQKDSLRGTIDHSQIQSLS